MKKNTFISFIALILLTNCNSPSSPIITIDTHDDINVINFTDSLNYTMDTKTQVNLPKMEAGGLDVAWFVVYTGQGSLDEEGYEAAKDNALSKFDAIDRLVNEYAPDQIELALSSDDVRRILGKKNYKNTTEDIRNRFKIALKNQLIRIYAKTIVEYSSSKIKIISSSETKGFYLVKTELSIGAGKPAFQVIYVMKSVDEKYKIVEVVANGLRLVKSLRKSLLPEIEETGIESVINRLESESKT